MPCRKWITAVAALWLGWIAPEVPAQQHGLLREVWLDIDGASVSDLTSSPRFPDNPSESGIVTDLFEAPTDVAEMYGQRMHGYLVPPQTGNYTFWISSDDGGALHLSTDENPANARLIARVDGWTPPREWDVEPGQRSAPIHLEAGRLYYVAALMKEQFGGDNLAVRWRMPDGTDQAPIVGTNLLPWGIAIEAPEIAQHPRDAEAVEGRHAEFEVVLGNVVPASFQWTRNGDAIEGGISRVLRYGPVRLEDKDAVFSVIVSNQMGTVRSESARLRVAPDLESPAIAGVQNVGRTLLRITFTEPVEPVSAADAANYGFLEGVNVHGARTTSDPAVVELEIDPLDYGFSYTIRVSGVRDASAAGNPIPPGTELEFVAVEFVPALVGDPPIPGTVRWVEEGFDATGSGHVGGEADAFQFAYEVVSGDFDRRVRVASFTPTDPFAVAGLMARPGLEPDSSFAAAFTTPAQVGSHFMARSSTGAAAQREGVSVPSNFPHTWLRLARVGNSFRAFASANGEAWVELGRRSIPMPAEVYFGFAVSSHDPREAASVSFRDASPVVNARTASVHDLTDRERPGPSSRRTPLVITEVMYHPLDRQDGRNLEFIEIHNADLIDQDLTGYRLAGSIAYEFPDGYVLPAGGYVVVAANPADVRAVYGIDGVLGGWNGELPNGDGLVRLRNPQGAILLEVEYSDRTPWPEAADGCGPSLVLARPSYGENDPRAWAASSFAGGSPGFADPVVPDPRSKVIINEVLANPAAGQRDFVELYNHGTNAVDLSRCVLTDNPGESRFRIPEGTILGPGRSIAFEDSDLGFGLGADGERVLLLTPEADRVLSAVRFDAQESGVATGRFPDGSPEWRRLAEPTPGEANAPFRVSEVVINEIMYAPVTRDDRDEFIELHNRTDNAVDLGGWSLAGGIRFRFPEGTVMPPGAYFVVARNRTHFLGRHPGLNPAHTFGDYDGSLSNGGERILLTKPVQAGGFRLDAVVEEVDYRTGGRWGRWSDGLGSSLERIDPNSDASRPSNWADSDDSDEAPWTTIEFTGVLDHAADVSANRIHLLAQGPGEYLVADVVVTGADGANQVTNGDFSSGLNGWVPQGNHRGSRLEPTGGPDGGPALRIVATGRGDTAVNRVRGNLVRPLNRSSPSTLRARVRWLRGWPEFLLRVRGNGIEAYGALQLPAELGTPGRPNSRRVANAGPAIAEVRHHPPVPTASDAVLVTARVIDPDGIGSVTLRWRVDPNGAMNTRVMRDDGTGGDAVAGDGIYSASIPRQGAGTLVAFHVEATDAAATPATTLFPSDAPVREALVQWGAQRPIGNLGVYRFWQRRADYLALRQREPLANDNLDCTFVYGDERVIYNASMRAKGSPWHGGSVGGDYLFAMPEDDRLLGAQDLAVVTLGNLGSDPSAQREQAAFWIGRQLGVPTLHRRHVLFYENEWFKGLYEDTEEPNGSYVDAWFPESTDGELYKVEDWFEFNDAGDNFEFSRDATLEEFRTTGGELKATRYRWSWRKRALAGSANDFTNFLHLVRTVNGPDNGYDRAVGEVVDLDAWMRVIALQHIVGNWDSYGYDRGKNAYIYLPPGGRWRMIPWDIDFTLGVGSHGPTTTPFSANDPVINRMWEVPAIRRIYWRAFQDAIEGPLRADAIDPVLDARYAALTANSLQVERPDSIKEYVRARREDLSRRILREDVPEFELTKPGEDMISTDEPFVILEGVAPIAVAEIRVNGTPIDVEWPLVNRWRATVPLTLATNVLEIAGFDGAGRPMDGLTRTLTVRYTGSLPEPKPRVVINEWMARNQGVVLDPADGATDDWFELYNAGDAAADLSGYTVTDNPSAAVRHRIPDGVVLPPGGFLLVWADNQPEQTTPEQIHVGFALSADGEAIALFDPSGELVDLVVFGEQIANVSQGRFPDGAAEPFAWMTEPTPGAPNISGDGFRVIGIALSAAEGVELTWNSVPGRAYRIEMATDAAGEWTPAGPVIVATGKETTGSAPGGGTTAFYRVVEQ